MSVFSERGIEADGYEDGLQKRDDFVPLWRK